jgi:DNA-binding GntR family transcriptional regulator
LNGGREPRYREIAEVLIEEIRSAKYPVGSMLPPELDLCERFQVSRFTMREALRRLHELGLVSRRRGAGTTVEALETPQPYTQSLKTLDELLQYPPETMITLRGSKKIKADRLLAQTLGCQPGDRWTRISLTRGLADSDLPICWNDIHILPEYGEVAKHVGGQGRPVYRVVEEMYGCSVDRIEVQMYAAAVSSEIAETLRTEPGTPAFCIVRRFFDRDSRMYEVSVAIHPAGRFSYSMQLRRQWQTGQGG